MSSAGPLLAPGSPAPPCPINFKCYSYPLPPSLSIAQPSPPAFHHHLGVPSPISALSWLILSCNWTGVPGDGRQHAPVPHVPSRAGPRSISSAPPQSNIPSPLLTFNGKDDWTSVFSNRPTARCLTSASAEFCF